jgi:uncharacterized membrane protein YcaP (DUF421 family)
MLQVWKALKYYLAFIIMLRLAGKRLAGQSTTFDLLVLVTLSVVTQSAAVQPGFANASVFVLTVFAAHNALRALCVRSTRFRHLVRGKPRTLVCDGRVLESVLMREGISRDEFLAGLRKLSYDSPKLIKLAVLEETDHISPVGVEVVPS